MGSITEQYSEGEDSHLDEKREPVNLACLLESGARLILFINTLRDLELQSRLLMNPSDLPSTCHHRHGCCPTQTLPLSA